MAQKKTKAGSRSPKLNGIEAYTSNTYLVEMAWEVCNQVGGIYTVIKSKVESMLETWGDNYCLVGPYLHPNVAAVFEPSDDLEGPFGEATKKMREMGFEVHYGSWLIPGRPRAILFNPYSVFDRLGDIKYLLWDHHDISTPANDQMINEVIALGFMIKTFFIELNKKEVKKEYNIIAHVHEWMTGVAIPGIRREAPSINIVFTTHATMLGRYLAMNDPEFYEHLPFYNWEVEAKKFNIEAQVRIERAAAHGSHVFTTVSNVTARECEHLLGRKADMVLPNGLNINKFGAPHEIQNLHQEYKTGINNFVIGHFFKSYPIDLDKTLYFFTSGRFEHRNKGFDITLEALSRLNYKMQKANIDKTVIMFFITKSPFHSINPDVLESRALLEEIRQTCTSIQEQVGNRLFFTSAESEKSIMPDLNGFVDDYWRLRLRRNIQKWKSYNLPPIITHNLIDDAKDPILNFLRSANMVNQRDHKVKIVYHPDFINSANPLFKMEYSEFVRGCHLGIFPSSYEPWGYTPLECMASGVPAVTSDLSGFGDHVDNTMGHSEADGLFLVRRSQRPFNEAADQLANQLFRFVQLTRRERINQRYKVEETAENFDWNQLTYYYDMAHKRAVQKA